MKTTITIAFDDGDAQAVADMTRGVDLGTLLRDALGEFMARRQPAAKYVAERYIAQSPGFANFKVREVEKRCKLAEILKRGDVTIEIDETTHGATVALEVDEADLKAFIEARERKRAVEAGTDAYEDASDQADQAAYDLASGLQDTYERRRRR